MSSSRERLTAFVTRLRVSGWVVFASLGTLYGASQGMAEVLRQRYLTLGFTRSIYLTLLDSTTKWTLLGGALGALWLGARLAAATPRGAAMRDFLRGRLSRPRFAMILLVVVQSSVLLLLFVVAAGRGRGVGPLVIGAALLASLSAALAVLAVGRRSGACLKLCPWLVWPAFLASGAVLANWESMTAQAAVNWIGNALLGVTSLPLLAVPFLRKEGSHGSGGRSGELFVPLWLEAAPVLLVAAGWVGSPWGTRPTIQPENPKNVVLIGIDTLRLDHTSLFRQDERGQELTPNLQRLASESWVYRNATSQAPWTLPAFSSVLTGRYPQQHGALSLYGSLPRRELLLAEVLREAGYATGAVASGVFVNGWHGFAQGVEDFDDSHTLAGYRAITSDKVTNLGLEFLAGRPVDRPFFLFLHYFDPHHDYRNHPGFSFVDDDAEASWGLAPHFDFEQLSVLRHWLSPADLEHLMNRYDEEIAYTDQQIGRLVDFLTSQGLMEDTAVVVVSDHGEEFMQHGWLGHVVTLHEELIRVPLILRLPDKTQVRRTIDVPVETRAIFSTIVDWLGIPLGHGGRHDLRRDSLLRLQRREGGSDTVPVFALVWLPDAPAALGNDVRLASIRSGDWKLILNLVRNEVVLFDLSSDPSEERDLAQQHPHRATALRTELEAWMRRMPTPDGATLRRQLGAQEMEQLKALGYL